MKRQITSIKKYKSHTILWDLEKNLDIYNYIKNQNLPKHKIEEKLPHIQWNSIWNKWSKLYKHNEINSIFDYLHDTWWTGELAFKRHIIHTLPKCIVCKKFTDSKAHLILQCGKYKQQREIVIKTIKDKYGYCDKYNIL